MATLAQGEAHRRCGGEVAAASDGVQHEHQMRSDEGKLPVVSGWHGDNQGSGTTTPEAGKKGTAAWKLYGEQ